MFLLLQCLQFRSLHDVSCVLLLILVAEEFPLAASVAHNPGGRISVYHLSGAQRAKC